MQIGISLPVRELNEDLPAIRDFAQTAEELGFTHLRVPDQVIRPGSGPLHEPLTLLSWIAGMTTRIELVPSVIILPERQTALVAKQTAEIDVLSGGRLRLGVGVGGNEDEYRALGEDFHTRGRRCDEQLAVLRLLWTEETVDFEGRWHHIAGAGLNPLPVQRPIPIWIGPGSGADGLPADRVLKRVGRHADGWFAILPFAQFPAAQAAIRGHAENAGRDPAAIGAEAAVAVPGRAASEWLGEIADWEGAGASHLCLRTLGAGLDAAGHLQALCDARATLDAR
ncbi:MAG: TIGR03619 family F420-dependent LLM class oxidoreductase [Chloroflexi bacterium]|nr:TIGR03619 family F420-dependent LLM class oxidoreductase [Chloroflexota bacterium]